MIGFAAPWFLAAGAALAALPLVLHMLARTPPERRPLPTARFLTADRRTRLRPRRPADLVLLALRMLLLLLLGAALARPSWTPGRSGEGAVVVLDAGGRMAGVWPAALEAARARLAVDDATLVIFDSAFHIAADPTATLDSLSAIRPAGASSWLTAFRGLEAAGRQLPVETARATLVTRDGWDAWSPAIPVVRERAWPGALELVLVAEGGAAGVPDAGPGSPGPASLAYRILAPPEAPLRLYVGHALEALGHRTADDPQESEPASLVVWLPEGERTANGAARDGAARDGAAGTPGADRVIVLGGAREGAAAELPWRSAAGASPVPVTSPASARPGGTRSDRLHVAGGVSLPGWRALEGRPVSGARVVAAWDDGRPAAAAKEVAGGCIAYLAAEPDGDLRGVTDPSFPALLDALARGCEGGTGGSPAGWSGTGTTRGVPDGPRALRPLDRGARAVLAGSGSPDRVELAELGVPEGTSLARLILALAVVVAGIETALAYLKRRNA